MRLVSCDLFVHVHSVKVWKSRSPLNSVGSAVAVEIFCLISLQSPEELERLTVDEGLTDIERALYLLR